MAYKLLPLKETTSLIFPCLPTCRMTQNKIRIKLRVWLTVINLQHLWKTLKSNRVPSEIEIPE
jgi:hypothetical protein